MKPLVKLEISGSYRDVGSAIGESFANTIQESIKKRKTEIPNYDFYLEKSKDYYEFTKESFPNLIEETKAIAKSANVNVYDYFFINNREVYDTAEEYDKRDAVNPDHCTIAVNYGKDGVIIGHNEDWSIDALDELYVLRATIEDKSFLGLNYKNGIAGLSASMNNFGLVQCINDLYQTNQFGVPKNYIARAVLECSTLEQAQFLIENTKRASGFNHVLVHNEEIRNIEIAGDKLSIQKVVSQPYVHTNHYLSSEMISLEKFHTKNSEARYERAKELIVNVKSLEDMKLLLSDKKNNEYPICRADATIGSVIAIPSKNEFWVCHGHPCEGEFVKYNL